MMFTRFMQWPSFWWRHGFTTGHGHGLPSGLSWQYRPVHGFDVPPAVYAADAGWPLRKAVLPSSPALRTRLRASAAAMRPEIRRERMVRVLSSIRRMAGEA